VWRSTVQKFSGGGSGFDPGFSETEKVRVVGVDQWYLPGDADVRARTSDMQVPGSHDSASKPPR